MYNGKSHSILGGTYSEEAAYATIVYCEARILSEKLSGSVSGPIIDALINNCPSCPPKDDLQVDGLMQFVSKMVDSYTLNSLENMVQDRIDHKKSRHIQDIERSPFLMLLKAFKSILPQESKKKLDESSDKYKKDSLESIRGILSGHSDEIIKKAEWIFEKSLAIWQRASSIVDLPECSDMIEKAAEMYASHIVERYRYSEVEGASKIEEFAKE